MREKPPTPRTPLSRERAGLEAGRCAPRGALLVRNFRGALAQRQIARLWPWKVQVRILCVPPAWADVAAVQNISHGLRLS